MVPILDNAGAGVFGKGPDAQTGRLQRGDCGGRPADDRSVGLRTLLRTG